MAADKQPKVAWLIRMRVKFEDQDAKNVAEEDQIHLQDNDDIVNIVVFFTHFADHGQKYYKKLSYRRETALHPI